MRSVIYARVSLDPGQGRSVTEQETECRAWAAREGWDVVDVITEDGSASRYARSTRARTRWREITDIIASGRIDILLVWEASRATRRLGEYAELRDLCARHGVLYGYSGTIYDLTQRDARFRTGLDALVAEDESARTSERVARSVRARAAAGLPHGRLPYGYRREYDPASGTLLRQVPDEATAPVVREIVQRIIDGDSLRSIAADLTDRGVTPPRPPRTRDTPREWLAMTVRRIALSPTIAGLRVHQGEITGPAAWPALITDEQHERVTAILASPARLTRRGDSTARHLLSGIALCGLCGARLRLIRRNSAPNYSCPSCMRIGRAQRPLDEHVTATVLALLGDIDPDTATPQQQPQLDDARAELATLEARLEAVADQAADGALSAASLARVEARLMPQIRAARTRVRDLALPAGIDRTAVADPDAWWRASTIQQKRALLRAAVTVRVNPSPATRKFRPECVDIEPAW